MSQKPYKCFICKRIATWRCQARHGTTSPNNSYTEIKPRFGRLPARGYLNNKNASIYMARDSVVPRDPVRKPRDLAAETIIGPALSASEMKCSVKLDTTYAHNIQNIGFGNVQQKEVIEIFKDGRVFSHLIEKWIETNYPLNHVPGCKSYDFTDRAFPDTKYDEKTFTRRGCDFRPSNMKGQGRKFEKKLFEEKTKKLVFCIVSNVNFPAIEIKFIRGVDLLSIYPNGKIPLKEHDKFFHSR